MKKITVFLCLMFLPSLAFGSFFVQHSVSYFTDGDNVETFSYNNMKNYFFIGASLDKSQRLFLGQSVMYWSRSYKSDSQTNESTISLMELGPRLIFYIDKVRCWSVSFSYNPYTRGTRTIDGENHDISGMSFIGTLSYQISVTKNISLGASINYHSVSISEQSISNTETDVSNSYTGIIPMFDLSIRTK